MGFAFVMFYVILGLPIARLVDRSSRRRIIGSALWFQRGNVEHAFGILIAHRTLSIPNLRIVYSSAS
jgi:hypothetical protein